MIPPSPLPLLQNRRLIVGRRVAHRDEEICCDDATERGDDATVPAMIQCGGDATWRDSDSVAR